MLPEGPRAYYHAMGSDPSRDTIVFGEQFGATWGGGCDISEEGRWLYCQMSKGSSADVVEVYVKNLTKDGPFLPVITGIDARFDVQVAGDRMYALTNWKAPNSRIVAFHIEQPAPANWQEIIPERPSVLESFNLVGG